MTVPIAQTTAGRVQGAWEGGVAVFRGIPYAEPPVGNLRFRPPQRRQRWDGVREATRFGEISPQTDESPLDWESLPKGVPHGDDCLNLNVWTPTLEDASLPVLFWIHGGSFMWGSGSVPSYDGTAFARNHVVVVTINYRLNAAGFLYVGDRPGSGCFGLLDQVLALEWVQENIRSFGGDPSRVTISGEARYRDIYAATETVEVVVPFTTDLLFRIPSIRLAEEAIRHNPRTYMFRFGWKGRIGAVHALEVPFMFDTLERNKGLLHMLGGGDPPHSLATIMHGAWVNFVKTGSPSHSDLPEWPAYDLARRATMNLDVESRVVDDPDREAHNCGAAPIIDLPRNARYAPVLARLARLGN